MGVTHFGDIRDQLISQFGIVVGYIALLHLPAASVHLIDVHRAVDDVGLLLCCLPCFVMPDKAVQVKDLAAVGRPCFCVERIGVGLEDQLPCTGRDTVFVNIIFLHSRDKQLPDRISVDLAHRVTARLPAIEVAHHADSRGMRSPNAEHHARLSTTLLNVCAKIAVRLAVVALLEQVYRKIGRISVDFFFNRFHKQLLPVQTADSLYLLLSYIKDFLRIFQGFFRKMYYKLFVDIFLIYTTYPIFNKKNRES